MLSTIKKALSASRVKFNSTKGYYLWGYMQKKEEDSSCKEIDIGNITDYCQTDYLDRYEGVQAEIQQVINVLNLVLKVQHVWGKLICQEKMLL